MIREFTQWAINNLNVAIKVMSTACEAKLVYKESIKKVTKEEVEAIEAEIKEAEERLATLYVRLNELERLIRPRTDPSIVRPFLQWVRENLLVAIKITNVTYTARLAGKEFRLLEKQAQVEIDAIEAEIRETEDRLMALRKRLAEIEQWRTGRSMGRDCDDK
jgi:predicted  nucleic acid-binding Zn-ribbon protein